MTSTEAAIGRDLRRLFEGGALAGLTEADLLDHVARRDELSEAAFEAILTRHGPAVLACCRRVLADSNAAEDAFQATFVVLFRQAGSIRRADPLIPWLLHVARMAALKARRGEIRRLARERRAARPESSAPETITADIRVLVRSEVDRLPQKYRDPVHLCYYEGRTQDDAAAILGWPAGTVRGRLSRAREMLRERLRRRGIGIAPAGLAAAPNMRGDARAEIPRALREATLAATSRGAAARAVVLALATAVGRGLEVSAAFKAVVTTLAAVALISAGAGIALLNDQDSQRSREHGPPVGEAPVRAVAVDRYGDPLPRGAIARLGTTRFRHDGIVGRNVFAPDGKTLFTAGPGQEFRTWEVATGRQIRSIEADEPLLGANHWVQEAVFSRDGAAVFVAGAGAVGVIDFSSGRVLRRVEAQSKEHPLQISVSPDGRSLAVVVQFNPDDEFGREPRSALILYGAATLARQWRIEKDHRFAWDLAFSPDGRLLAIAGPDVPTLHRYMVEPQASSIRLLDVASGAERRRIPFEVFGVASVAFAPDGKTLAAGVGDRTVRLYDPDTGSERLPRLGHARAVAPPRKGEDARKGFDEAKARPAACLAFSPDGSLLASGPADLGYYGELIDVPPITLWDVASAREIRRFAGHPRGILSLAFAPDGKTLASSGYEPVARIWDVATGREVDHRAGHPGEIISLEVSQSDGTVFTAGNADGLLLHWDPNDGRLLERVGVKPSMIDALAISPDGGTLFVLDPADGPFLWDLAAKKELRRLDQEKKGARYSQVVFSPDGRTVAGGHWVWDVATGRRLLDFKRGGSCDTSYSADGRRLIAFDPDGVSVWDIATATEVRRPIPFRMPGVTAFSRDGRLMAVDPGHEMAPGTRNTGDRLVEPIRIWELASGKEVATLFGHTSASSGLAFSPDGRMLASVSGAWDNGVDPGLRIWDVSSGKPLRRLKNPPRGGLGIAYLPNGRAIVTGSQDGTALVWDVSDLADRRPPDLPDAKALETLWSDLASDDAPRAHRASWSLSVDGAVPFLRDRLRPAAAGEPVAGPEVLRTLRAIAALERVGTPSAQGVLETLRQAASGASVNREAADTLLRLARRKSRPPAGAGPG